MTKAKRPVVLLGGLNIMRPLGLAGIPVIVATSDLSAPSLASRYCSGSIALPPLRDNAAARAAVIEELVRAGKRLAAEYGGPVPLFYDNDDRLALVQDFRADLSAHFAMLLNAPAVGDALLDKALFQSLAERHGLPVPRRIDWSALASEPGPVLVKPKVKTAWDDSNVHNELFGGAGKARVFETGAEAHADARALPLVAHLSPKLAFQEYIPGDDDTIWSFHGFSAPGGEVLEWFVGRKIRTYPALTGDSAYVRLARDGALVATGRDISKRLGLAGVFKMDFKRSPVNGRFYLLEVNTRFNLWNYVGAMNGVNLAKVAYEYLVDAKVPVHKEAKLEYRWLSLRYDRRAYRELKALGKLDAAGWLWSLAQAPKVYDLFAWTDPMPFVRHWCSRIPAAFSRRMNRWLATAS
jgi:D-aspartate ligase